MTIYMTEEEQLEAIKTWWKRHHQLVLVACSLVLLIISGFRYWHWHQDKVSQQASTTYEKMMLAFSNQDNKSVRGYASRLIGDYKTTVYADVARLTLAKLYVDKEHYIKAQQELSYVAQHSRMVALKQIARIRLARLLTAEKSYQSALEELKQVNDMAFMPVVNELQGDILEQLGDSEKALDFYQKALNAHQANGMANLFLEMKTNELVALIQPKPRSSTNKEV